MRYEKRGYSVLSIPQPAKELKKYLKNIWIEFGVWTGENLRHLHKLSRDIQSYCIIYNKTPYKLQHKYIPVFFPHNFYTKQRAQADREDFYKIFSAKTSDSKTKIVETV